MQKYNRCSPAQKKNIYAAGCSWYTGAAEPKTDASEEKSWILAHVKSHIEPEEKNHHHLVELLSTKWQQHCTLCFSWGAWVLNNTSCLWNHSLTDQMALVVCSFACSVWSSKLSGFISRGILWWVLQPANFELSLEWFLQTDSSQMLAAPTTAHQA